MCLFGGIFNKSDALPFLQFAKGIASNDLRVLCGSLLNCCLFVAIEFKLEYNRNFECLSIWMSYNGKLNDLNILSLHAKLKVKLVKDN